MFAPVLANRFMYEVVSSFHDTLLLTSLSLPSRKQSKPEEEVLLEWNDSNSLPSHYTRYFVHSSI